mgnify:CR=1 FL=1
MDLSRKLSVALATGLCFGYSPVAPGTVGTVWGVLLVLFLNSHLGAMAQVVCALALSICAVLICDDAEAYFGTKDDRRIVADEYLTFPLCMVGLPAVPWLVAVAFVSHRVFDIVKPPPARRLQDLGGGLGVVADDVVSSLYSLAFNYVAWIVVSKFVSG